MKTKAELMKEIEAMKTMRIFTPEGTKKAEDSYRKRCIKKLKKELNKIK